MLTRKQQQLLMFINDRLEKDGVSPSFEEMKEALGLKSKSGIHRLIIALEERGFLRRLPHRARALEVMKLPESASGAQTAVAKPEKPNNVVAGNFSKPRPVREPIVEHAAEIPLHGKIAAGTPVEAIQNVDSYITVPPDLLGAGEHYALTVSGDSMQDLGILDGDTAVIKRCDVAENGAVVVALVDQEEATLKTLYKKGAQVALQPANSSYSTQLLAGNRVTIQGKLVGLIRRY